MTSRTRPHVLGLTGGIGMGKSTTSAMFAAEGVPVWDADAVVHALYGPGGGATQAMAGAFPGAVGEHGVDRAALRAIIASDPAALARIEAIVHPLVAADRQAFLARAADLGHEVVVLDVPLLFEGGTDRLCDSILVVSAPPEVQRARVLARGHMSEADLDRILARQMPDQARRDGATWVIETTSLDEARAMVHHVLSQIGKEPRPCARS